MRPSSCRSEKLIPALLSLICCLVLFTSTAFAAETPLITSVDELTAALLNAEDGDTILVGDIVFKLMPMGMIQVPKNVTIKSGKASNAVFTNATFGLNGSTSDSSPLTVRFENIDFRGDRAGKALDLNTPPSISSDMPGIMKTMCAGIFKMNVAVTYSGCSFEGYHYGYGGVFNAIYSSSDNRNELRLTLTDCTFRNNVSKFGGSIYLSGYSHNIHLKARRCVFEDNAATTGGAIWAQDAAVDLTDCCLIGNRYLSAEVSSPNGGALALYNCAVGLDGCLIANNTSGGDGAGIFCEISPFKTLIMQNCTVIGNRASRDGGISLSLAPTNFDTSAMAHIYFSSLFGDSEFADHVELFGCLLVNSRRPESEPSEENGYCLIISPETAQELELELLPDTPEHVVLPEGEYPIPEEATEQIAGGKFSDSLGKLQVGDNYAEEATVSVQHTPAQSETIKLSYGDTLVLEPAERRGYSFEGWESPEGEPLDNEPVFMGGTVSDAPIRGRWHFLLSENLYLILLPVILLAAVGAFVLLRRRTSAETAAAAFAETAPELGAVLPEDWIDRACERPDVTAQISKREMEVLRKLLEGKSRKQIAEELFITESTVKKHTTSIYAKLQVSGRVELISKLARQ